MKGSPHINGTSNTIVEEFIKGSKEAHHEIKMLDVAHANLHRCLGCDCCGMSGECTQKDGGNKSLNDILSDYLKMNEVGRILVRGAGTPSMIRKEYLVQAYNLGKNLKYLFLSFIFLRN